ncbi:MAG: hypothetical protein WAO61_03170 [Solirubrobacterales bacterium]
MSDRETIDEILAQLAEPGGFDGADRRIGEIAPQLQGTLDAALGAGGWFDEAHESAVLKASTAPDQDARIVAVRQLVLEQTRLGMLVGVAVGWEIAERLEQRRSGSGYGSSTEAGDRATREAEAQDSL